VKSWVVRYRFNGVYTKFTLGKYPSIGIAAARKMAQGAIGDVARGTDPAAMKRAARAETKKKKTETEDLIENVVDEFVRLHAKPNTRDWAETDRILKKDVVSVWRGKKLGEITKRNVTRLLDAIAQRAPIGANRVFAQLRQICSWAVARGIIDRSPCEGVTRPTTEKGRSRERVLSDEELRIVLSAADELRSPFGPIIRLLALTGQRRDEVGALRWAEIDLDQGVWTLPGERAKNGRVHTIPLAPAVVEILRKLPHFQGSPFVFGLKAPAGWGKAKARLDARVTRKNGGAIPHWTFHDLRRTMATGLQKMGVRLEVTEAVLNHVGGSRGGIVGVYQRHHWAEEKRAALNAWAERVAAIEKGESWASNIVVIHR
jgi:integrase